MPERIQQRRTKGWRMPPNTVSVARPHRWGNPFRIVEPITRDDAVRMFRELVLDREAFIVTDAGTRWEVRNRFRDPVGRRPVPTLDEIRAELAGKNLACFCPLDQPCHGDVLLELANPSTTPEGNPMSGIESLPRQVFETGWEQKPGIDECAHVWKSVAYRSYDDTVGFEDKCERCGSPRCPHEGCVDRRHHHSVHIFEDGSFEPLGGVLPREETR